MWVEFLRVFTFVLKHISGQSNKVVDALSIRSLILQENQVQVWGFEFLKYLYEIDMDLKDAYEDCVNPLNRDRSPWNEFMIQDGLLLKKNQLCIPNYSMRENLI